MTEIMQSGRMRKRMRPRHSCSFITYHSVRENTSGERPGIMGFPLESFMRHLDYFASHYTFVTIQDCIAAIRSLSELPEDAILLTFDDGYRDHFTSVFPILKKRHIQGCFFLPVKTIMTGSVLAANKLQLIMASERGANGLMDDIMAYLDSFAASGDLKDVECYLKKASRKKRFDGMETSIIKNLLQKELPPEISDAVIDRLFLKYAHLDEASLSKELYMDGTQADIMRRAGMCIGGHGYEHRWLPALPRRGQEEEIKKTARALRDLGIPEDDWIFSYPYGGYDDTLIYILKKEGFKAGFTTIPDRAYLSEANAFTLQRFDALDITV